MRAVILAAGRGGRLSGVVGDWPKGLAVAGDCTLIERQIRVLRASGIDRVAVVAGFRAPAVRRVCGTGVDFVENRRFASTNSLYSLWLARDLLADGFVVLNCDVLFHPQLLVDLLTARYEDALLMSARGDGVDYSDEEMKVHVRRGRVVSINKAMPPGHADGENVGIAKFGPAGAARLVEEMSAIVQGGGTRHWLPHAFEVFAAKRPLHVVETRGFPWIEIDFPEDYWRALGEVLPAIGRDPSWETREPVLPTAVGGGSRRTMRHV